MKTTAFIICFLCTVTKLANGRSMSLEYNFGNVRSPREFFRNPTNTYSWPDPRRLVAKSDKITDGDWAGESSEGPLELKHHDHDWTETVETVEPRPEDIEFEHERTDDESGETEDEDLENWSESLGLKNHDYEGKESDESMEHGSWDVEYDHEELEDGSGKMEDEDWTERLEPSEFKHRVYDNNWDESGESLAPGPGDIEYEHERNEDELSKMNSFDKTGDHWMGPPEYSHSQFKEFLQRSDDYGWTESDESVEPGDAEDDYDGNEDELLRFKNGDLTGNNGKQTFQYNPTLYNDEFLPDDDDDDDDDDDGVTESPASWNRDAYRRIESESADSTIRAFANKNRGLLLGVPDGSMACYEGVDFGSDYAIQIEIQLSSCGISAPPGSYGRIDFSIDSSKNKPFTTVLVGTTHDWDVFSIQKQFFHYSITGVHNLYLTFHSNVRAEMGFVDVDWFRFHK